MRARIFHFRHANNKKNAAFPPHVERSILYGSFMAPKKRPVDVLAVNMTRMMTHRIDRHTVASVAKAAGVGVGTVQRAKTGAVAVAIDTLEDIARALGLEAWQLLVPDIDPANPPVLRRLSPEEHALYEKLRAIMPVDAKRGR